MNLGMPDNDLFLFHKPFGIFDYVKLQKNAYCNLSDSGTIHEDAGIMGIPAVVVRESSERPEAFDTGNVILSGVNLSSILLSIDVVRSQYEESIKFKTPEDYQDLNVSDKVIRLIIGLCKLVPKKKYLSSEFRCLRLSQMVDMKILIVVNNFYPEIGSASHIYFDLAKAFVKRGHEIDVITSYPRKFNLANVDQEREFPLEEEIEGIKIHRMQAYFPKR